MLNKLKNHLSILLLGVAGLTTASAQALPGWQLVWADEFDQANGSSPNPAKWNFDIGTGCPDNCNWGNNELQYYTSRTNNVRIENGHLIIEALRENSGGRNYTSARLKTQDRASWAYGRIEARLKIPRGQGIWPAFWMLGTNITSVGWPTCGEIDIMENIGSVTNRVHGTIHGPGYSGGNGIGGSITLPGGAAFADDFHVYAVEWTTNRIRWFMDGQQYFTATPASLPAGAAWVFTQPQFLLLNVAVGGNWPGPPNDSTVFPQRMVVDYVRVYAVSNPPPTASGALLNGRFETGSLAPWVGKNFCCANPQGGNITDTNGLVWNPALNAPNTQGIRHPAFGAYACKVYGNFNGSPNAPGFYQDVTALPGSIWTATIKARTQHTDHIRDDNRALVEVSFLNATSTVLAKYASQLFDTNAPINTWIDLDVTQQTYPISTTTNQMHAPPGTVKARFEVTFFQTLYGWGSIYFDEAQLQEVVPPIIVPPMLSASLDGEGNIQIVFDTQPGVSYQVVYKHHLGESQWHPLETVPGDGNAKSLVYPLGELFRFYAVQP